MYVYTEQTILLIGHHLSAVYKNLYFYYIYIFMLQFTLAHYKLFKIWLHNHD